jgi:hypothetical protein
VALGVVVVVVLGELTPWLWPLPLPPWEEPVVLGWLWVVV